MPMKNDGEFAGFGQILKGAAAYKVTYTLIFIGDGDTLIEGHGSLTGFDFGLRAFFNTNDQVDLALDNGDQVKIHVSRVGDDVAFFETYGDVPWLLQP